MPDPLKLEVLRKAGFEIRATCGSCVHFDDDNHFWGDCTRVPSAHSKHTDGGRLSVRHDGWCPGYQETGQSKYDLQRSGFEPFKAL